MCQICGHTVQFFNGIPSGEFPLGTIGFDYANNYSVWVFNGGWQQLGSAFSGGFQNNGGTVTADYQAVAFFNGMPTGRAVQGAIAFDTSSSPYQIWVFSGGWQEIGTSVTPAADLLSLCGPNVIFGVSTPPPGTPPRGTIFIPTNGSMPEVFNPPAGGWVPINISGGPPLTKHQRFITNNTDTTITWPADWNNSNNSLEILAGGGVGDMGSTTPQGGGGGGGGAYQILLNAQLTPGSTTAIHFGTFSDKLVWIKNNLSTIIIECECGADAVGPTGGAGGVPLVPAIGGHKGGKGGNAGGSGGGGGGGAGGPLGDGGDGGDSVANGGAGGGGGNKGFAGQPGGTGVGGNGGDGDNGAGSGGAGMTYPPALNNGGDGLSGGGGGGPGGGATSTAGAFGDGGRSFGDSTWAPGLTHGVGGGGSGGAGRDANIGGFTAGTGGSGFNLGFGGGGGGSGGDPLTPGPRNGGAWSLIVLTWYS